MKCSKLLVLVSTFSNNFFLVWIVQNPNIIDSTKSKYHTEEKGKAPGWASCYVRDCGQVALNACGSEPGPSPGGTALVYAQPTGSRWL